MNKLIYNNIQLKSSQNQAKMSTPAQRRLLQDLQKLKKNNEQGIDATPDEQNIYLWQGVIYGPIDTIWEGATFRLRVDFCQDYPNKPPNIVFLCKMFHPNIYSDGKICLDILSNRWSPMYDISALLTSIRSLLSDPNPESPANQQASKLFKDNAKEYERRVKEIVEISWKSSLPSDCL